MIAIEPLPANFRLLKQILIKNNLARNVKLVNCAVSDRAGRLSLWSGSGIDGNATVEKSRISSYPGKKWEMFEVKCRPLDGLVGQLRLERVDWIEIDVEGREQPVLKGAMKVLRKFRPKVFIEVLQENEKGVRYIAQKAGYTARRVWQCPIEPSTWYWLLIPGARAAPT